MTHMNTTQLKKLLDKLMKDPEENIGEILRVSSQLAKLDPNRVWFSVDAGLIKRLGQELVARQETALAELIKNAYDADATVVDVRFDAVAQSGGTLIVDDDGNGMSREELVAGFMRISTSEKVREPLSPRYGRQRAGRKGIGRFAAQRLGQRLVLTTQTEGDDFALKVEIDWTHFAPNNELVSISSQISMIDKEKTHGTTLRIEGLADAWSDAKIQRVYRYVLDLLQPARIFKERKDPKKRTRVDTEEYEPDPGFTPKFTWQNASGEQETADEHSMFLDHAAATIKGWVDDEGNAWWRIRSQKHPELDGKKTPLAAAKDQPADYPLLKGIEIEASYFILDEEGEYVPHLLRTRVIDVLKQSGGIRVFRNGFRVMPYGQPDDDWLGLDASYSKRSLLPSHKNSNFIGFVKIEDPEGTRFEETVSREGLIENDAFGQLTRFGYQVLIQAVTRVASVRGKKIRTSDAPKPKPFNTVRQIAEEVDAIAERDPDEGTPGDDVITLRRSEVAALSQKLKGAAADQDAQERNNLEERGMLRVLASLGLTIGQFTHEIRHDLSALTTDLGSLLRRMQDASPELRDLTQRMRANLKSLQTFAAYFDRTIAENVRRELHPQDLRKVLSQFNKVLGERNAGTKVKIDIDIQGANIVTRPMHASEWSSILMNLYTNADKAIRKEGAVPGKILIRVRRKGERIVLLFADNGCGVPEENRERIFDAFFTTSAAPSASESDENAQVQGTGLGLKIVRDMLSSAVGTIKLTTPPSGYRTCFEIELPVHASAGETR